MLDHLPQDVQDRLARYLELLEAASARMNLIGDPPDRWTARHLCDALELAALEGPIADVGSGAGLPGLVLAIVDPDRAVTLIESVGKKAAFLQETAEALGLTGVQVLRERAEIIGQDPAHRERYRASVCRGLARPAAALELTLPLVAPGGSAFYYLGSDDAAQFEALPAIAMLGGQLLALRSYRLPDESHDRFLAEVRKIAHTPEEYPRRPGTPKKQPLG